VSSTITGPAPGDVWTRIGADSTDETRIGADSTDETRIGADSTGETRIGADFRSIGADKTATIINGTHLIVCPPL
jgi:hypothetical protein